MSKSVQSRRQKTKIQKVFTTANKYVPNLGGHQTGTIMQLSVAAKSNCV